MTSTDCLLLDAKHAILDEHHRKFQALHDEGRLDEAIRQFHVTLSCASGPSFYQLSFLVRPTFL